MVVMAQPAATRIGSFGVSPEELAGLQEVAELLGVTKRTATRYVDRDDFPDPLGRISTGRVWWRKDVEKWARNTLPLRAGRPPKEERN
jgi:predicted DNA-binding transcriptional regulator AlpA